MRFLYSLAFFLINLSLFAQDFGENSNQMQFDAGTQLLKMFFVLVFIIIAILVSAYFLKKYFDKSKSVVFNNELIEILARRYLSQKKILYLIKVGNKIFLVCETPSDMTPIGEIDDEETIKNILENSDNYDLAFEAGLKNLLNPFRKKKEEGNKQSFQDSLAKLTNYTKDKKQ